MKSNNKRIAKNTLMLYFRMMFTMGISLYTSRIALEILGIEDFGIYNVVGGIVVMFSFINSAMTVSTQRFLNFELGKNNIQGVRNIFCMGINIHILFALAILFFAETIGLWFLNNKLVIPDEKIIAANWVYQFSILSTIVTIITIPYNALIIAHERMNAFAYLSICESVLKLAIILMLTCLKGNVLILYAFFLFIVTLLIRVSYYFYCKKQFRESRFMKFWSRDLFKEMFFFASWNFWGATSGVMLNQGVNILLNLFFGPTVNAARAIAVQIQGAINQFVQSFMQAVNPQIVKSYAANDTNYMFELVLASSKYSFFLISLLSFPLLVEMNFILGLWLKEVPANTAVFSQLIIVYQITVSLTYSLNMASQASGNVKLYQIVESGTLILIVPVSYLLLRIGFPAYSVFIVMICFSVIALSLRLMVLRRIVAFPVAKYLKTVVLRIVIISVIFFMLYLFLAYFPLYASSNIEKIMRMIIAFIIGAMFIYLIGLCKQEQFYLNRKIKALFVK